jgi:hypothetical protein
VVLTNLFVCLVPSVAAIEASTVDRSGKSGSGSN